MRRLITLLACFAVSACENQPVEVFYAPIADKSGACVLSIQAINELESRIERLCDGFGLQRVSVRRYTGQKDQVFAIFVRRTPQGSQDFLALTLGTDDVNLVATIKSGQNSRESRDGQEFERAVVGLIGATVGPPNVKYYKSSSTPM